MTAIEELIAKLGLDVSEFKEGMAKSGEAVTGLNEKMEAMQKGFAAGAVGEFLKKTLEMADGMVNLSENLGVTTDSLQALSVAGQKNGASAEELNAVWARTKQELDKLRAGNEDTARTFAMLGLKVEDFQGLGLDESLEKIAKAYAENSDRAGAYDALQQVVGKSGRNLTSTLGELAEKGFGGMIQAGKDAHEIIDGVTLKDLAKANNTLETVGNTFRVFAVEWVIAPINKIMTAIGTLAGGFVELGSALLKGGPFTEAGRTQMKDTWEIIKSINAELETKHTGMSESAAKTTEETKKMRDALAETAQIAAARQKYEEAVAKAALEGLGTADKLAALEQQIADATLDVVFAKKDSVEYYKAATELARLTGEYAKVEKENVEGTLAASMKLLDQKRAEAPLYQQRAIIEQQIREATAAGIILDEQGLDTEKASEALAKSKHDLKQLDVKLAQEEVKIVADLLSGDRQRVQEAVIRYQLLNKIVTTEQLLGELYQIMAKPVGQMTEDEKARAAAIFSALEPMQQQSVLTATIGKDVEHLTDDQKAHLAVLKGQTSELKEQRVTIDGIIDAWTNFTVSVGRTGAPYSSQSTVALEGSLRRLQSQLDAPLGSTGGTLGTATITSDYSQWLAGSSIRREIQQIQDELNGRARVSGYLSQYGEDAARGQFGDEATNKAMQDLSANSKQTAADIREISDRLSGRRPLFQG